jgi:predicted Rossmann-fold nucleotide-binding protein
MLQTDAVVVMPGGVGTLDELTEVVAVNDMASKMDNEETAIPVILVNVDDYFNYFSQLLQHMVDHGAVAPGIMKMFHVVPDASSAIEKLQELGQSEPVLAKELLTGEDLDEEKAKKVRQAPEKKVAANANMPKTLPGPQISNG